MSLFLISCSDDVSTISGPVGLPSFLLGTYTGNLEALGVQNNNATVTLVETNTREYNLTFSDNIGPLTNLIFSRLGDSGEFLYFDDDTGVSITVAMIDNVDKLGVRMSSDPQIDFLGEK